MTIKPGTLYRLKKSKSPFFASLPPEKFGKNGTRTTFLSFPVGTIIMFIEDHWFLDPKGRKVEIHRLQEELSNKTLEEVKHE